MNYSNRALLLWSFFAVLAVWGCSTTSGGGGNPDECEPGEIQPCTCPDGSDGTQKCKKDGSGYTRCNCDQVDAGENGGEDASTDGSTDSDSDSDTDVDIEGAWRDDDTSLYWQEKATGWKPAEDAPAHCEDLELGGYDDWRLPTIGELRSLIKGCAGTAADGACGIEDDCTEMDCITEECAGCESSAGPGAEGCYRPDDFEGSCRMIWSSSAVEDDTEKSWYVNFIDGRVSNNENTTSHDIRCVRGGS